jgi:uncharacterized protein (TIGR03437 family)
MTTIRISSFAAICLLLVSIASAQTATVSYSYNGYPVFIAVDDADVISYASIVVPDALRPTKVTVKAKVDYSSVGDLNLFLFSPDGTRTKLLERNCGGLNNVDTTFDDAASARFSEACPAAGQAPFRGNEPLSNMNNIDSSIGVWRLAVENNGSNSRTGWLVSWSIEITGTRQLAPAFRWETILNNAGARNGVIAPGEKITILGVGLGPTTPVTAPAGAWPTTLGDVRVSINGTDIPLSYVSNFRIDGQVPFGLTSTSATVQIRYGSNTSSNVTVNVQPTFPGIYAIEQSGIGQAKAVNQDGRLNSKAAPARTGEVITIWASGLGTVNPAVTAGQPAPSSPLSVTSQTVAASIGGVPATVLFAGLGPGYAGIYQLNILVPAGVPAGTRDIVISAGGNASQGQVTVEIQ